MYVYNVFKIGWHRNGFMFLRPADVSFLSKYFFITLHLCIYVLLVNKMIATILKLQYQGEVQHNLWF